MNHKVRSRDGKIYTDKFASTSLAAQTAGIALNLTQRRPDSYKYMQFTSTSLDAVEVEIGLRIAQLEAKKCTVDVENGKKTMAKCHPFFQQTTDMKLHLHHE